jgi:hypothetical protein
MGPSFAKALTVNSTVDPTGSVSEYTSKRAKSSSICRMHVSTSAARQTFKPAGTSSMLMKIAVGQDVALPSIGPLCGGLRESCSRCVTLSSGRTAVLGARSAPRETGEPAAGSAPVCELFGIPMAEPVAGSCTQTVPSRVIDASNDRTLPRGTASVAGARCDDIPGSPTDGAINRRKGSVERVLSASVAAATGDDGWAMCLRPFEQRGQRSA